MADAHELPMSSPRFVEEQRAVARRSEPAASLPGARFDIAYGSHPRQRLDVFPAGDGAPVFLFFRGGFWVFGEKEDRRFPAIEWQQRGVAWIVPNYRLAPEATLPEIVDDARAAFAWVEANGGDFGIDRSRIHLVGNSAGAHLSAMIAAGVDQRRVRSLTLISGLFDLVPLLDEEINESLRLDPETARTMSPTRHLPSPRIPVSVCCGGDETPAFLKQSREFADLLEQNGSAVKYSESPGKSHIGIIDELGTPETPVFEALKRHLKR